MTLTANCAAGGMRSGICRRSPSRAPSRLLLEIEIRWRREGRLSSLERPVVDGPGRREAAGGLA